MTEQAPDQGPLESQPGDNPAAPDPTQQLTTEPDTTALAPEDVRTQPPEQNKGSGQYAVWDQELGQYVSGVSDKAGAAASKKALEDFNGAVTDGHTLEVREV